jgi:hypothetical protein
MHTYKRKMKEIQCCAMFFLITVSMPVVSMKTKEMLPEIIEKTRDFSDLPTKLSI